MNKYFFLLCIGNMSIYFGCANGTVSKHFFEYIVYQRLAPEEEWQKSDGTYVESYVGQYRQA